MWLALPINCRPITYRQPLFVLSVKHGLANQTCMKSSKDKTENRDTQTIRDLPPYLRRLSEDSVSIAVHVKPCSKVNNITVNKEHVSLAISAPAREGEANASATTFLADVLGVKKRQVELSVGSKSREKVFKIYGLNSEQAMEKLNGALCQA